MNKKKLFSIMPNLVILMIRYYDLAKNRRMEIEKFWTEVIYHLKNFKHNN